MQSIWEKTVNIPQRESLSHTLDTDIAIIGAGLTGVLTGYFLQQAGRKVILLDAKRIGSGQTRNTTAKITSQHNLIYHKLINKLGIAQAQQYADANQDAIAAYRNLITEQDIDCDFETCNAYLYSTKEAEPLLEECKAAKRLGIDADCIAQTELPFPVVTALRFSNQARFNPLKFNPCTKQRVGNIRKYTCAKSKRQLPYYRTSHSQCQKYYLCLPLSLYQCSWILFYAHASGAQLCSGIKKCAKHEGDVSQY